MTTQSRVSTAEPESLSAPALGKRVLITVQLSVAPNTAAVSLRLGLARRVSKRKRRAAAAMQAAQTCATVCFDLGSFEDMMSGGETNALARQVVSVYGYNRSLERPFCLALAGLATAHGIAEALASHSAENWVLARHDAPPWSSDAFGPDRELIYLSSDAQEELRGASVLDKRSVLIIGGLVDYEEGHEGGTRVGAALRVAQERRVRAARLPLDEFVKVRKASLTCLAVVQILAGYVRTQEWGRAIREAPALHAAPLRKYVVWKGASGPVEEGTNRGDDDDVHDS